MLDFALFEPDGGVHIFDWAKAREIGAKVSIKTRMVGRGKECQRVRTTDIRMPARKKVLALLKLLDHFVTLEADKARR